jgi:hypothetical protein
LGTYHLHVGDRNALFLSSDAGQRLAVSSTQSTGNPTTARSVQFLVIEIAAFVDPVDPIRPIFAPNSLFHPASPVLFVTTPTKVGQLIAAFDKTRRNADSVLYVA